VEGEHYLLLHEKTPLNFLPCARRSRMSNCYGGNEIFHNTQRKVRLFNGQHRMANLPCMQEQNAGKNSQRHGAFQFSVDVSQVQTGKLSKRM